MEMVEIRFRAVTYTNKYDHSIYLVKLHVVKGPHNRYIGDFESIDSAVVYALNNGFQLSGIVRE